MMDSALKLAATSSIIFSIVSISWNLIFIAFVCHQSDDFSADILNQMRIFNATADKLELELVTSLWDDNDRSQNMSSNDRKERQQRQADLTPWQIAQLQTLEAIRFQNRAPAGKQCHCRRDNVCPVGPPGRKGSSGSRGLDGKAGKAGKRGLDAGEVSDTITPAGCKVCPVGNPGRRGHMGTPGRPGQTGKSGAPGLTITISPQGRPGSPGHPGTPGIPGNPGLRGPTGNNSFYGRGPRGKKGGAGISGEIGFPGQNAYNGNVGLPGDNGDTGLEGQAGPDGVNGKDGEQGQTGPPGADALYCPCPARADESAPSTNPEISGDGTRYPTLKLAQLEEEPATRKIDHQEKSKPPQHNKPVLLTSHIDLEPVSVSASPKPLRWANIDWAHPGVQFNRITSSINSGVSPPAIHKRGTVAPPAFNKDNQQKPEPARNTESYIEHGGRWWSVSDPLQNPDQPVARNPPTWVRNNPIMPPGQ